MATCHFISFENKNFQCSFKDRVVCHHHPDAPLIEDYRAGDMICSECGLIVGDRYVIKS